LPCCAGATPQQLRAAARSTPACTRGADTLWQLAATARARLQLLLLLAAFVLKRAARWTMSAQRV
jgi:hypothetical protein